MSLIKCLASISLAAITLPTLHSEPHCPGNAASIRFRLIQRSRIIVPVTINHTGNYEFLVDTGTESTIVDPSLATELHLKTHDSAEFVVGFSTQASFGYLDPLEAGSHLVSNHVTDITVLDKPVEVEPARTDMAQGLILTGSLRASWLSLQECAKVPTNSVTRWARVSSAGR